MESSQNSVPELSVNTEYVRRTSESYDGNIKPSHIVLADNSETARICIPDPSPMSQLLVKDFEDLTETDENNSMKRNDSYTKFGHMETVSLDVSEQETQNLQSCSENASEATNSFLSTNVESDQLGNALNEANALSIKSNVDSTADSKTELISSDHDAPTVSISKYFTPDANTQLSSSDVSGIEFFEDLSKKTVAKQDTDDTENKLVDVLALQTDGNQLQNAKSDTETKSNIEKTSKEASEAGEKDNLHKSDVSTEKPSLLKFFAEDKSGSDITGKAFFDKIATENSTFPVCVENSSSENFQKVPNHNENFTNSTFKSSSVSENILLNCLDSISDDSTTEAWIPTEQTRQVLIAVVTSISGTFYPKREHLTLPTIIIEEEMDDPIRLALLEANSPLAQQRRVLSKNDVTADTEGLKKLIKAQCYHAAINLSKQLLEASGYSSDGSRHIKHTPYSLQLWFLRIALFVKLRKFSFAEVESEAFGDLERPDLYYEFYPDVYCGRKGSMVPFSFRLLLAELPQHQGNHQVALDNLYRILSIVQKIICNLENGCAEDGSMVELSDDKCKKSLNLWYQRERRVLYSVLNCVLSQKDYVMTVAIVKILLQKDHEHSLQLYSALGRIYLQLGDIKQAQQCFNQAASLPETDIKGTSLEVEHLINKALLSIAHNENEEAYRYYQQALSLQPHNPMLANNMAVCLLYMGRLKDSLSLLEQTVQQNPQACLHDGILFNICTLYELESSQSTLKKYAMLDLVSKHAGDNFNLSCLKLQPNLRN